MLPSNDDFLLIIYGPFRYFRAKNHEKYFLVNKQTLEKFIKILDFFSRTCLFIYYLLIVDLMNPGV